MPGFEIAAVSGLDPAKFALPPLQSISAALARQLPATVTQCVRGKSAELAVLDRQQRVQRFLLAVLIKFQESFRSRQVGRCRGSEQRVKNARLLRI
jgi:hypothetical protein